MLRLSWITLFYLFSKISANIHDKFHGKHSFPRYTPYGNEAANEFQMIQPEHIIDMRRHIATAGTYSIKKVSPTVIKNDDVVTISFQSLSPSTSDWIGAYSPANVNISETVPVKYGYCDDSAAYLSTGAGELTFNLTNLRADVGFYYFKNGVSKPMLVDISTDIVTFEDINEPLRPRVVATGDINVLNLLWSSATSTKPVMKWGTLSGVYNHEITASTSTIEKSSVCGSPANTIGWRELGLIHTAAFIGMTDLAGQQIYYTFGDAASNTFSDEYVLFVPPIPGMTSTTTTEGKLRPTRAILYDDLGRGSTDMSYTWNEYGRPSVSTMYAVGAEVLAGNVDVVYHGGDISYATGYLAVWDFFLDMISPVARSTLYLSTVGNHESDWYNSASYFSNADSGGECGVLTTTLLPQPQPATLNKPWWSYEVGMFHFIGISTEHNFTIGTEQYNWLVSDLQSVDRSITPWVIFGGHRAMYLNSDYKGSGSGDIEVMDLMITNLEPVLYKYQVNLGFYGHNHVVQRQSAVLNKKVIQASTTAVDEEGNIIHLHDNPQATVHMVVGTGGAGFTKNAYSDKPEWNELYFYQWGYAKLTAVNASYLQWEWVDSQTGETVDRMVITQQYPLTPWN